MLIGTSRRRAAHLWQLPLLMMSAGIFALAAGLFINARPGLTFQQKLSTSQQLLADGRFEAAAESLQHLLSAERFPPDQDARIHGLISEALEGAQRQQPAPAAWKRIIEESRLALAGGDDDAHARRGELYRRIGRSYEALGQAQLAIGQYRQAESVDPAHALFLSRRIILLQIGQKQWQAAAQSLDSYLASKQLSDTERAWACRQKAGTLIEAGRYADARSLLNQSLRLDGDPLAQAEANCRLGVCVCKMGDPAGGQKLINSAREALGNQDALYAQATFSLAQIAMQQGDNAGAIEFLSQVIDLPGDEKLAITARLNRGQLLLETGDFEKGVADLEAIAAQTKLAPAGALQRDEALAAIEKASDGLMGRDQAQWAIELLNCERSLLANPPASFDLRLAKACEKRADQVEIALSTAPADQKIKLDQMHQDLCVQAADAQLAYSKKVDTTEPSRAAEAFIKSIDLYQAGHAEGKALATMEEFASAHPTGPAADSVILRLASAYESSGQTNQAIQTYARLLADKAPRDQAAYSEALFNWARLECGQENWKLAAPRLEEFVAHFAADKHRAQAAFLLGECYRDVALQSESQAVGASASAGGMPAAGEMQRAIAARLDQWRKAADQYDLAIKAFADFPPTDPADQRYEKLAGLRRADCAYEQGQYADAIDRYGRIAQRYANDPVALAASVQIVNAYCELDQLPQARQANKRAQVLLKKMPRGAFEHSLEMPRAYWEQWLKWSATSASM